MAKLNKYEAQQVAAIEAWKNEKPSVALAAFDRITAPVTQALARVIPLTLVKKAIEGANNVSQYAIDAKGVMRGAEVDSIDALRSRSLRISDHLAHDSHVLSMALSGAGGAVLGATGVGGVALDVASLLTLSLRTIHRIGLCYGFERVNEQLVLGILSVSSAGSQNERKTSIELLKGVEIMTLADVWKDVAKDALFTGAVRGGAYFTMRRVSLQMSRNFAKRKAAQLVPVVGGAIGAATNICFLRDVGWAARRVFQERWLIDNGRLATG